ncbi:hypothetical protein C8R46DRAFT_1295100 [Mycena filopes]|nr:hypothetical protein C8R46DRAFT_1295100 [Mycena filopes]
MSDVEVIYSQRFHAKWSPIWLRKEDYRSNPGPDLDHEASTAKLWAIYVAEAEKYDKALVESWKSDMDGILIFAGLFSASLTAFIIESYKTLNPDPADVTVVLLSQISRQLAAVANGSSITIPTPDVFVPTTASLVCNALWFISLGLSLSSALVATLLEQWARDFLHRADMGSSPVIRARIFSYLYYGMKRFNMHTVVEVIPLLLHASLAFFFAGLVAFLLPVNKIILGVAGTIIVLVAVVYAALTVLPLRYLDCPYRTPLSGALWRLQQWSSILRARWSGWGTREISDPVQQETVVEAIFRSAKEDSLGRDCRAVVWTMESLADDMELEPFIEAIPDILWGPQGRRRVHDAYIMTLVSQPGSQFARRIENLLRSADSNFLSKETAMQRRITCFKAIWAICSLTEPGAAYYPRFDLRLLDSMLLHLDTGLEGYISSALALAEWTEFCALTPQIDHILQLSRTTDENTLAASRELIQTCLKAVDTIFNRHSNSAVPIPSQSSDDPAIWTQQVLRDLSALRTDAGFLILIRYLLRDPGKQPYEYESTRAILRYPSSGPSHLMRCLLPGAIHAVRDKTLESAVDCGPDSDISGITRIDEVMMFLAGLTWLRTDLEVPTELVYYLNERSSPEAVQHLARTCDTPRVHQWLVRTLSEDFTAPKFSIILGASWFLINHFRESHGDSRWPIDWEPMLDAVVRNSTYSPHKPVLLALLKFCTLESLLEQIRRRPTAIAFPHPLFPTTTAIALGESKLRQSPVAHRYVRYERSAKVMFVTSDVPAREAAIAWAQQHEARVLILTEFLEAFAVVSTIHPDKNFWTQSIDTLEQFSHYSRMRPTFGVHRDHQIRLASIIAHLLEKTEAHTPKAPTVCFRLKVCFKLNGNGR